MPPITITIIITGGIILSQSSHRSLGGEGCGLGSIGVGSIGPEESTILKKWTNISMHNNNNNNNNMYIIILVTHSDV